MNSFIIIWILWCASEVLLNRLLRSGSGDKKHQDRGSLLFMWMTISLAVSSGIICSAYIRLPLSNQGWLPYMGLGIIVSGMVVRFIAVWTLGKLFTVDVTIRDNHEIKTTGLYKIMRHPSYTGSILSFIGFGITLNNWLSLTAIVLFILMGFLYRMKVEEQNLLNHFGTDYVNYMKKTYRLIPWIY